MKLFNKTYLMIICFLITAPLVAQEKEQYDVSEHYNKQEVEITMRDGIKLHTTN